MTQKMYYGGNIITVNDALPKAEAVLIEDDKIKAVGTLAEVQAQAADDVEKVDLAGKTMLPGFVDGHSHIVFSDILPRFDAPPIGHIDSIDKLVEAGREFLEKNPIKGDEWFVGLGYDNASFPEGKAPTIADIDRISTEVPIVMLHASGHVGVCNSKVFEIAGVTKDTPNPPGGVFEKDPVTGELTGMAGEDALNKGIFSHMPMMTPESMLTAVLRAQEKYLSYGVTTAQEGKLDINTIPLVQNLYKMGKLKIDIYGYPPIEDAACHDFMQGHHTKDSVYEDGLRIVGVKLFLDGSPQAKTAWLTHPYYVAPESEDKDYQGFPVYADDDKVCGFFKDCLQNGWQILVHCNGDAAIDQFINQYDRAKKETGITTELRPLVVHCQTVREDQLDRMKEVGMFPTYFHDHTLFWGDWYLDSVLGPELGRRISPLASTVKRGMPFTLHQDSPVAPPDMLLSVHNAVNRKTMSGRDIGHEYTIDPMEALRAVTIYGAYLCFEEDSKGSIETGKLADFVILDKDPLTVPKNTIRDIKVLETIKRGETVYTAK